MVCPGPGFKINTDGSLSTAQPRVQPWPYASITVYNGLRADPTTGLWISPSDIQFPVKYTNSLPIGHYVINSTTATYSFGSFTIANPDPCRALIVQGVSQYTASGPTFSPYPIDNKYTGVVDVSGLGRVAASTRFVLAQATAPITNQWYMGTHITVPFTFVVAAGATVTVTPGLLYSSDTRDNAGWMDTASVSLAAMAVTQRTAML